MEKPMKNKELSEKIFLMRMKEQRDGGQKISVGEYARRIGVSRPTYSNFERFGIGGKIVVSAVERYIAEIERKGEIKWG